MRSRPSSNPWSWPLSREGGPTKYSHRAIVNAIFYVVRQADGRANSLKERGAFAKIRCPVKGPVGWPDQGLLDCYSGTAASAPARPGRMTHAHATRSQRC